MSSRPWPLSASRLAAFEREALVRLGNIPEERVRSYARLQIGASGCLERIVEKPDEQQERTCAIGDGHFISMNCWHFDEHILRACEEVPRSTRSEFELPEAVQHGIRSLGLRFKAVRFQTGVLNLSYRADIAEVAKRLARLQVDL
jgi:dTDP-glucose pyrophosphorylase